jgi:hypothetical protein
LKPADTIKMASACHVAKLARHDQNINRQRPESRMASVHIQPALSACRPSASLQLERQSVEKSAPVASNMNSSFHLEIKQPDD